jgi:ParB-like chromosome segregation protein Spo0J
MNDVTGLAVTDLPLARLKAYPRNARTHSRKQIAQVADSIRTFGFNVPILVDEDDTVLAGHARLAAARSLGLATVPCVRLSHMSKAQKKAFVLADNRLALSAGWDEEILSLELRDLAGLD